MYRRINLFCRSRNSAYLKNTSSHWFNRHKETRRIMLLYKLWCVAFNCLHRIRLWIYTERDDRTVEWKSMYLCTLCNINSFQKLYAQFIVEMYSSVLGYAQSLFNDAVSFFLSASNSPSLLAKAHIYVHMSIHFTTIHISIGISRCDRI